MPHFWRQYTQILLAKHILVQLSVTLSCLVHIWLMAHFSRQYTQILLAKHISCWYFSLLLVVVVVVVVVVVCLCVYVFITYILRYTIHFYSTVSLHLLLLSVLHMSLPFKQYVLRGPYLTHKAWVEVKKKKKKKKLHHQQQQEEAHKQTRTCV